MAAVYSYETNYQEARKIVRVAYFDCAFGAAGDMLTAALLAAGVDLKSWNAELEKVALPTDSFRVQVEDVLRCAIKSKKFTVECQDEDGHWKQEGGGPLSSLSNQSSVPPNAQFAGLSHAITVDVSSSGGESRAASSSHSHTHEASSHSHAHSHGSLTHNHSHARASSHSHGHSHGSETGDAQGQETEHTHDETHEHDHEHHHGRTLADIEAIISASKITPGARRLASTIFANLADAEAAVHGKAPSEIHFHEVGAIDAIIDVIGFAIAFDLLGIDKCVVSPLTIGSGTVRTAHGLYMVPPPAVAYLLQMSSVPTSSLSLPYECLTPTGAAILITICDSWGAPPSFQKIDSIGFGAGAFDPPGHPNVVRVMIGELQESSISQLPGFVPTAQEIPGSATVNSGFARETVAVVETNLDDCSPELLSHIMQECLESGALDVFVSPVLMKKGRSGHLLTVLTAPDRKAEIEDLILRETTTLGVRGWIAERAVANRTTVEIQLEGLGQVRMKLATDETGKTINVKPEFEDCVILAKRHGLSVKEVLELANVAFRASRASV